MTSPSSVPFGRRFVRDRFTTHTGPVSSPFGRRFGRDRFVCSPLTPIPQYPAKPKDRHPNAQSKRILVDLVEFQLNIRDETDCVVYQEKFMVPRNQKLNKNDQLLNDQMNLSTLLREHRMGHLVKKFEDNHVDIPKFIKMKNQNFGAMGISLPDRVKLLAMIP